MAVHTDILEDELIAFIADYDIGSLLSYKGIAEGVENSNFLLHTQGGHFILTLYEKRVNPADLPFFLGLMNHLSTKGMTCPQPIRRTDGETIGHLAGRPAAIISFLEGMWPRRPDVRHCRQVGEAMARMHLAAADFSLMRPNALSLAGWRPLFESTGDSADDIEAGLKNEISQELDILENNWPEKLPAGVIHADLFPDNVFFLGDKLSGLIDFYFACNDFLTYDLAVCLNAWCFERDFSFNLTKGRALCAGYQSVRKLNHDEAQALPLLARGAALRFLLTRLYDWNNTPEEAVVVKKDPREYLRRLRFHTQIEDASEYGLERV